MSVHYLSETVISQDCEVLRLREYPSMGTSQVSAGEKVGWETILGYYIPRVRIHKVRVDVDTTEKNGKLFVTKGQHVKAGETIGHSFYFFGLGYTEYISPCDGEVIEIDFRTGTVFIQAAQLPFISHMAGTVESVEDPRGVWVKGYGDFVMGAAGVGYARSGDILVKTGNITPDDTGKVIVLGEPVTKDVLEACLRYRVSGIVTGAVSWNVFQWYRDLVKNLTWDEFQVRYWTREMKDEYAKPPDLEIAPALLVTQGFGQIPVNDNMMELFRKNKGRKGFIDGSQGSNFSRPCLAVTHDIQLKREMSSGIESVAINHIKPGDVVEVLLLAGKTEQLTVSQVNRANNIVTGTGIEGITVKAENGQESFVPLSNITHIYPRQH